MSCIMGICNAFTNTNSLRHYNQWGFVNQYTQINGEVVNGLNNHTFKKIAENANK